MFVSQCKKTTYREKKIEISIYCEKQQQSNKQDRKIAPSKITQDYL
jgi:hypothetical protein